MKPTTDETTTTTPEITIEKYTLAKAKLKEIFERSEVQRVIKQLVDIPDRVFVRAIYKRSEKYNTQKVEAYSGSRIEEIVPINFTISGDNACFLDPVQSVNKWYRITDYTLGFLANSTDGNFSGYSATGLKLIVHKLEEVK